MKLIQYIHNTLVNRATALLLKCGAYKTHNNRKIDVDYQRVTNLYKERRVKWNLEEVFTSPPETIDHRALILCYPKQLCPGPNAITMLPSLAGLGTNLTMLPSCHTDHTCKITGLRISTQREECTQIYIGGRRVGFALISVAARNLHEWPDGTFRDNTPETAHGAATDQDGVGGYHGQHRPWAGINFKDLKVFGIELETLAPNPDARYNYANLARKLGMLAERDGSLAELGLEIIGKPEPFEKCIDPKGAWNKWIEQAKEAGFTSWYALNAEGNPGGYGMHVNLNRRHFNALHLEKLIVFINNELELSRKVAGRSSRQYALLAPKVLGAGVPNETDKYQSVALRGASRVEVRIFRGTMNWCGFCRNIEFVDAAIEFTRVCGNDEVNALHFMKWLDEHNKTYPNLTRFLPLSLDQRYQLEI